MKRTELTEEGNNVRFKVVGSIDETFTFPAIDKCEVLIIDLDGMTRFTSAGIRNWMKWAQGKRICTTMRLENCRPWFIEQMGIVKSLIPPYAIVESFYVPFYDAEKDSTLEVRLVRGKDFDETQLNLPKPMNAQGQPLELDTRDSYFAFLRKKDTSGNG